MASPILDFVEEELDRVYLDGVTGGETYQTSIIGNRLGIHQRNVARTMAIRKWKISFAGLGLARREALRTFFNARYGMGVGFRFYSPTDHTLDVASFQPTLNVLGTGNGSQTVFALYRTYKTSNTTVQRRICKVVNGTQQNLQVYYNGVLQSFTYGVQVGIDINLGIVNFATPPGNGVAVTIGGAVEYNVPVCFDVDSFESTDFSTMTDWSGVGVVELLPQNIGNVYV